MQCQLRGLEPGPINIFPGWQALGRTVKRGERALIRVSVWSPGAGWLDGDRVMAVYIGDNKNSAAAKTALQISFIVKEVNSAIKKEYPNTAYQIRQAIGIDTAKLLVAKTGIRNSNDLVWVGRAANYAAKLCGLVDNTASVFITETVFNKLSDETKHGGSPRRLMWEKSHWQEHAMTIYKSSWSWKF